MDDWDEEVRYFKDITPMRSSLLIMSSFVVPVMEPDSQHQFYIYP